MAHDMWRQVSKLVRNTAIISSTSFFIAYHIKQTCNSIYKIVNTKVLDREKQQPEFIYIDDPIYNLAIKSKTGNENTNAVGLARIWKSFKHSLAWKLLWLCRHGNKDQRNIAIEQLAAFKNNKVWDCCKLAQALDMNTAVLLARTKGADLRYFLPPPIHVRKEALSSKFLSYKFRELIVSVQNENPHYCIKHIINKYFINPQEQILEPVETDCMATKPDSISERDLCLMCLDTIYHHINLFYVSNYEDDCSIQILVKKGIFPILAETLLRYKDIEFDLAVLKVLTVLSAHANLVQDFYQNGLLRELTRFLRSTDIRLSSSAAGCLANLSGEYSYRPGLYLLHPLYRTSQPTTCDALLVHGLRGGVFVTWRQRDRKCAQPLGIIDVTVSESDCIDPTNCTPEKKPSFNNPDLQEVIDVLIECDDESTLGDLDVVLHDIPVQALREPMTEQSYIAKHKRLAIDEEREDKCSYTQCWPKDWLPKDCNNVRVLGVNYWSSLSEWFETCPAQSDDIETRASKMLPALIDAGVGMKNSSIVWLSHSMGGLIAKQALVQASRSLDEQFQNISKNTKAVLFFSTPHRGTRLATMPRAAAAVICPSSDVRQLEENCPTLLELHNDFLDCADKYLWETISFGESLPTLITAFKVPVHFVESFSSDLGRGVFYQLPLDHLSICKPATRQSVLYTTVLDVLKRASVESNDNNLNFFQCILELIFNQVYRKITEILEGLDDAQNCNDTVWAQKLLLELIE